MAEALASWGCDLVFAAIDWIVAAERRYEQDVSTAGPVPSVSEDLN